MHIKVYPVLLCMVTVTLSSVYIKVHVVGLCIHKELRFSFVCAIILYRSSLYTLRVLRLLLVYVKVFVIIMYLH